MARFAQLLLLGLVGAAIVHVAVLLLVPLYSDKNAWAHLDRLGEQYAFNRLTLSSGVLSNPDPLIEQAACLFDLSEGPVHIRARGNSPFWSLSIYAPNGDNLYSINDSVSNERILDLVIADPLGVATLSAGNFDESQTILVGQSISDGAVILRTFVPDTSWQSQTDKFLTEAECIPMRLDE